MLSCVMTSTRPAADDRPLKACRHCGAIQHLPTARRGMQAVCCRCEAPLLTTASSRNSRQRTLAAALAAFVLYIPAVTLPLLRIRELGHYHSSSILSGAWELLTSGSWFVGAVVLVFSVVLPVLKIGLLLDLCLLKHTPRRHRAATYRLMEQLGRWSMMDVLLVALLVMFVKLGNIVEFQVGPAVWAFALCVAMTMVAAMSFDPNSIWDEA
jgi:paraquat-inducible protein A